MALAVDFNSNNSLGFTVFLCLVIGFGALAWVRIISKAGFSGAWNAVPLLVSFLTMVLIVVQYNNPFANDDGLGWVVLGTWFVSMILFFLFAFIPWPVGEDTTRRSRGIGDLSDVALRTRLAALGVQTAQQAQPAAPPVAPAPGTPDAAAPGAAAPPATSVATVTPKGTFFCSWCGKERDPDAFALHACGSRDRPAVYCAGCGHDLVEGGAFCANCGTSAAQQSPR